MVRSRVIPSFALTCTWNAIAAFSKEYVAKLIHGVLQLYLVVCRPLAIGSCKSELYYTDAAAINFRPCTFGILFSNNHDQSIISHSLSKRSS